MNKIVYIIDPQSVSSLAAYDRCMIDGITDIDIHFFGNKMYNDRPFNSNVKFFPVFSYNKFTNPILKGISYLVSVIKIIVYALKERPSIAHLQWIRQWYIDWLMILFLKKIGIKIVFTVHNILPRSRNKNTESRFKKLYRASNLLIAHTETTKKDLEKRFNINAQKIIVMPHGVIELNVSEYDLQECAKQMEADYKFGRKIIFGALGVQSPYKGTDLLINSWIQSPILNNNSNVLLLIAGKPSGIDFPNNLPENVIVIPRLLNNPEFKYLVERVNVMVLPYREIEQSGVLLTLINKEKPYCCTCVGELAKPIEQEEIGWKIEDCSEPAITDTLIKIINNPKSISEKKNNKIGWKRLKKEYSWERSNKILKNAYLYLIESPK